MTTSGAELKLGSSINASPGDLAPVFDAMLEKALHLCEAVFGVLVKVEGEHVEFVAQRNVPQKLADFIVRGPMRLDPATILGRSIIERQIVHTLDNADSDAYRGRAPLAVAAVELGRRTHNSACSLDQG